MKAKAKCPNCGEIIIEDCLGCISGGTLLHDCGKDKEPEIYDVEWKIIECDAEEAEAVKKLGFKGEIPKEIN